VRTSVLGPIKVPTVIGCPASVAGKAVGMKNVPTGENLNE